MAVLPFPVAFVVFGAIVAPHSLHFADRAPICFPQDGQDLYPLFFAGARFTFFFAIGFTRSFRRWLFQSDSPSSYHFVRQVFKQKMNGWCG